MLKDCSCRGLNENCYKCFGSGYYNDNEPPILLPIPTKHAKSANKPRKSVNKLEKITQRVIKKVQVATTIKCPYCPLEVANGMLMFHVNQAHPLKPIGKLLKVKCPHCKAEVNKTRLKRHIKKVHPHQPDEISSKQPQRQTHIESTLPQTGKRAKLNSHRKKVNPRQPKGISSKQPQKQNEIDSTSGGLGNFVIKEKDGADGWHVMRDRGKFGSFPSFDAMDDESSP